MSFMLFIPLTMIPEWRFVAGSLGIESLAPAFYSPIKLLY